MIIKVTGYDARVKNNQNGQFIQAIVALARRLAAPEELKLEGPSHCTSCKCRENPREIFKEAMRSITSYPWEMEASGNLEISKTIILNDDNENRLWTALAPFMVNGSWITITYEKPHADDEYRIYFDSGRAYTQNQVQSWPDSPSDDESEEIEVPLEVVPDAPAKAEEAA